MTEKKADFRRRSKFAEMLAARRTELGITQRDLASLAGINASAVAVMELDRRGKPEPAVPRTEVWNLVKALKMWPPECDRFLEAAGHDPDRSATEELDVQRELEFDELWVFARYPLDAEDAWFRVVLHNIAKRQISYRYFLEDDTPFINLLRRLREEKVPEEALSRLLECTIVPPQFFISNFAVYIKERRTRYCCGTKSHDGKAEKFYAVDTSEASRLFQMLRKWRDRLQSHQQIPIAALRRIHPGDVRRSPFLPLEQT